MYFLIKPASGACNLRCKYCFYADEMQNREHAVRGIMTEETAECIIRRALGHAAGLTGPARSVSFGFQGGEPMLAGLPFFRHFTDYVREQNTGGVSVSWFLQTNGTLMTAEWAEFLAANRFLVGLSLDGFPETHDKNRVRPDGRGTYSSVLQASQLLKKAGAEFNILTVLTGELARSAAKMYRNYRKLGFVWQQYIPCLAPLGGEDTPWTLSAERYGDFLCRLFDLWYSDLAEGKETYNREFENWVGILAGREPEDCGMRGTCSPQYLVESDGSVYPCDFYALDAYCIGNLKTDSVEQIDLNRHASGFISASELLPEECRQCRWFPLCRGGCRRNRDETGKNRFCEAYQRLFAYAFPRMQALADMIVRKQGF